MEKELIPTTATDRFVKLRVILSWLMMQDTFIDIGMLIKLNICLSVCACVFLFYVNVPAWF